MLTMAELLILFDHVLLAILFLIALFCAISAVSASFYSSPGDTPPLETRMEDDDQDDGEVQRTDTCYSVKNGTSILIESDLIDVV